MRSARLHFSAPFLAALLVPIFYLFFYTPFGMDTTDFGYFYAYGWRILEGQIPYRDFAYIKPCLPLYWHAFWMWLTPDDIEILAGKAAFMFTVLASAWLGSLYLARIFQFQKIGLPLPLLATTGFVFGIHTFPHMPWHTADGILFSSAALCLSLAGPSWLAGILAACALCCKQSFLLVPVAIFLAVWRFYSPRRAFWFLLGLACALFFFHAWLYLNGALENYLVMTRGQLAISEALDAGIFIYLRQNWLLPFLALLPWIAARMCKKDLPPWLAPPWLYMGLLCLWYITDVLRLKTWTGFGLSWPTLFMLLGALCVLAPKTFLRPFLKRQNLRDNAWDGSLCLAAALVTAWSVAISGGYKIPAMFATPLIFSFCLASLHFGVNIRKLAWFTLICGLLMFWTGYQYPYTFPVRLLQKSDLALDAGAIYPKANGVKVDRDMYERLAELKYLREKYGPRYKTLPGFTLSYYLNNDRPLYGSDWLIDWEINGQTDKFYQDLLDKKLTVFMERDQMDSKKADAYERAGYTVPQKVRNSWKIVEETPHFVVFQTPE